MKYLIKVIAVLFAAGQIGTPFPAFAEPGPAITKETAGSHITFSELVVDFGKVKSSDMVQHDFIVTNTGKTMLEVSDVKPGCGCMMAGAWDRRIQPGRSGKIPIQFNPAKFNGPVTKSIMVTCNDPAQAVHSLQIQATIWRPIDVQPALVYFTPIAGEETSEAKVVRIISNVDQPLTLEPPQCSNPAFKLEMKTVQPAGSLNCASSTRARLATRDRRAPSRSRHHPPTSPLSTLAPARWFSRRWQ